MIEEEVGELVSDNVSDVLPAKSNPREDCETNDMMTDSLSLDQYMQIRRETKLTSGTLILLKNKVSIKEIAPLTPHLLKTKKEVCHP